MPVHVRVSNTTGVDDDVAGLPRAFALQQNYPKPFSVNGKFGNATTSIKYELPEATRVTLTVYALNGRRVPTLEESVRAAGAYEARWNGRDEAGRYVTSGVYFYQWQATTATGKTRSFTKKLTLLL